MKWRHAALTRQVDNLHQKSCKNQANRHFDLKPVVKTGLTTQLSPHPLPGEILFSKKRSCYPKYKFSTRQVKIVQLKIIRNMTGIEAITSIFQCFH